MVLSTPAWQPRLSRRALLRRDPVRGVDVVLLPERVIKLNPSGAAVLRLCDGRRTPGDIVAELQHRYAAPGLDVDVMAFLGDMVEQGVFET